MKIENGGFEGLSMQLSGRMFTYHAQGPGSNYKEGGMEGVPSDHRGEVKVTEACRGCPHPVHSPEAETNTLLRHLLHFSFTSQDPMPRKYPCPQFFS